MPQKATSQHKIAAFGSNYMLFAMSQLQNLQLDGVSYAMPAQSLEIDEALLYQHADELAPGCIVLFGMAACVPFYGFEFCTNPEKYYDLIDRRYMPQFSWRKWWLAKRYPVRMRCMREPGRDILPMEHYAKSWTEMFGLKSLKEATFTEAQQAKLRQSSAILARMFKFCTQRGFRPVVVIPPFGAALNTYIDEPFVAGSLKRCVAEASEAVPVLDFRTQETFQHDAGMFWDGGFSLSERGSRTFIRLLCEQLTALGIEANNSTLKR